MQGRIPPHVASFQGKKAAKNRRRKSTFRPFLEPLEDRITPYVLSGYSWASTNISASFMPDGTMDMGHPSDLFALYNASYPTATWQLQFAKALQTWADASALNFHFVAEQIDPTTGVGYPSGIPGLIQGDPRFGDIRLGASSAIWGLGHAIFPGNSTMGGDITLNGAGAASIGSSPDLYSILLHEAGGALGLGEGPAATSVMNGPGPYTGLYGDDIAGIQALYGTRPADTASHNLGSPTPLALASGGVTLSNNITSIGAVDYYQVTAPANGSLTVSVDARNLSLFQPKVAVFDAAGNLLATASANIYGSVATVNLNGLVAGQTYILEAAGATTDVFGMGAYKLIAQFGSGGTIVSINPPSNLTASPSGNSQINLSWNGNNKATGYVVDRSTDGMNWFQIASVSANSNSYADTTVSAGLTYFYEVFAVNGSTFSSPSNMASATLAPLAPGTLNATAVSSSQINLAWSDVTGETGFTIERTQDGITWTEIDTTAGVTSYQDTGLAPGTFYTYQVSAYNAGGSSPWSYRDSATTIMVPPAVPTGLTVTTVSSQEIDLTWNDVPGETNFRIQRSPDGVNWVRIAILPAGVTSYDDIGLHDGRTYYYRIRSGNAAGFSALCTPVSATTPTGLTFSPFVIWPLAAPTGLTATTVSSGQINLSWNDVVGESNFRVQRSSDGVNWTRIAIAPAGTTSYQDFGLVGGQTYYYRVRAGDAAGVSPFSNIVSVVTCPPVPAGLSATAISSSQINLAWSSVNGDTGFLIERSLDGFHWTTLASTAATVTSFRDSGLSPITTYYYRVIATNASGSSGPSSVVWTVTDPLA